MEENYVQLAKANGSDTYDKTGRKLWSWVHFYNYGKNTYRISDDITKPASLENMANIFELYVNKATLIDLSNLNTCNVINLCNSFYNCTNLQSLYFYNTESEIDALVELLKDKDKIMKEML